ncbi:MAG: rod shape-determining protein MreD [Candidatus Levybacteria bacterium]|nr:rod shape-determining protein MreD [Candidatus Levybacteria bacterium]MBI2421089.1 rod shape-determining protein MreD [Candidatus Levybacteria bacterium]
MIFVLFASLILVFIETVFLEIPLVFIFLLNVAITKPKSSIFLFSFLAGIALDVLSIRVLGTTSLFFLIFFFLLFLYEKKFEIRTFYSVFVFSLIGGILYAILFDYGNLLFQGFISTVFSLVLYKITYHKKDKSVLSY